MENKRVSVNYIENTNPDGGDVAGIIINVFNNEIIIGVTEQHGGDAEISLNIEKAMELVNAINSAIELARCK